MKIAGRIFRNTNVLINTCDTFQGFYKSHEIIATTNHGHGKPKHSHLQRYDITVTDTCGSYVVNDWKDCHDIKSAIIYALDGANL